MTRVDFYLLGSSLVQQRLEFACRLTEKAWRLGRQVYLHMADSTVAREFDQLLWQFRSDAFVPHRLIGADGPAAPVLIGWQGDSVPEHNDLLINLSSDVPHFFNRFQRTAEIVIRAPDFLQASRRHWRTYQQHGCELQSHEISGQAV